MVDIDRAVVARLKKGEHVFEILVDCDKALEFKKGKDMSIADIVATDAIFKDVKKGEHASEHMLQEVFQTEDPEQIAKIIIKKGDIQLTAKHAAQEREEKRKRVVDIIRTNAVDPRTGAPHPPQRIEAALTEAGVHINENKSPEDQIDEVVKKIYHILPLKMAKKELSVKVAAQYAGQTLSVLKKHKLLKSDWLNDGSLLANVEIPAGIQDEVFDVLNKISHGSAEIKILKVID